MAEPPSSLAVIPARGGSKRIPSKNVRPFGGRPLIAHTVEAAITSGVFRRVVVSTDDEAIAEAALDAGAEVPFLREPALADDHTASSAVTLDALERLEASGSRFTWVAQLLPTCPLRDANDIRASFAAFRSDDRDFQISVVPYGWLDPWWALELGSGNALVPLFADALKQRSQDLPELLCPTGSIWWATCEALRAHGTFYGPGVRGFVLAWQHGVDIDTLDDLAMAETLLAMRTGTSAASG